MREFTGRPFMLDDRPAMAFCWVSMMVISSMFVQVYSAYGLPNPTLGVRKCGKVHLTVSSLKDTYLEMNWNTKCDKARDIKPDYIGLYDYDPRDRNEEAPPRILINASHYPDGFYRTKIKFGFPWLPGNWEYDPNSTKAETGTKCFPYHIASLKGADIIDSGCFGINPTWMYDIRDQIKDQRIENLFIPGTHNSGAYSGQSKLFFENYIINQDRSVWTQLVHGVRYLDFRIGYYVNEGFFINHDLVRITRFEPILKEIRKFAELAPKEVVIVDLHRFPYPTSMNLSIHRKLVELIQRELGHLALPPMGLQGGKGPTMNEIWHQNRTLIISYGQIQIAREYPWLWNPITQHWGDKISVGDLRNFMSNAIKSHNNINNPMWALMAELTPKPLDLLLSTNKLRKLADDVNRHLTVWLRDEWAKDVNIVATDFFLGNDLVNVAIEANKQR